MGGGCRLRSNASFFTIIETILAKHNMHLQISISMEEVTVRDINNMHLQISISMEEVTVRDINNMHLQISVSMVEVKVRDMPPNLSILI